MTSTDDYRALYYLHWYQFVADTATAKETNKESEDFVYRFCNFVRDNTILIYGMADIKLLKEIQEKLFSYYNKDFVKNKEIVKNTYNYLFFSSDFDKDYFVFNGEQFSLRAGIFLTRMKSYP